MASNRKVAKVLVARSAPVNAVTGLVNRDRDDTIVFTSFLSVVAHFLLIFSLGFAASAVPKISSIELVLLQEESKTPPQQTEFKARRDQLQSGEVAKNIAPRVIHTPLLVSPNLQPQSQLVFSDNSGSNDPSFNIKSGGKDEITATASKFSSYQGPKGSRSNSKFLGLDPKQLNAAIASIEAYLGELEKEEANEPAIKRYTSIAAEKAVEADYIHRWVKKIEVIGNLNYPAEALKSKISGSLRLLVVLSDSGEVLEVQLLKSSGSRILDDAARNIVHLAAPFGVFPPELRQEADIIEIVRTWNFVAEGDGLRFNTKSSGS